MSIGNLSPVDKTQKRPITELDGKELLSWGQDFIQRESTALLMDLDAARQNFEVRNYGSGRMGLIRARKLKPVHDLDPTPGSRSNSQRHVTFDERCRT